MRTWRANGQSALDTLELRVLGTARISPAELQQPRILTLLAVLALHPHHPLSRDQVAELLWPGRPANKARTSLRQLLHLTRTSGMAQYGLSPIETDRHYIRLNPDFPLESDLARFQQALEAGDTEPEETLWRGWWAYKGPFLADLPKLDAEIDFRVWVEGKRADLREQARQLAQRLIDRSLAAGDYDQALQIAARYRRIEPENDQGARLWDSVLAQTELAEDFADRPPPRAEQRVITVLYCALSLPAEGDPETRLATMAGQRHQIRQVLEEHGGQVEVAPEGSVVGYFGLPPDAEAAGDRAWRAARALQAMVQTDSAPGTALRIGLHRGSTLMDPAGHPDLLGELVQQALAEAHAAAVGEIRATAGARSGVSDERRGSGPAPPAPPALIGRRPELARLLREARALRNGQGAVVRILGEPGVGKTRLLDALQGKIAGRVPVLSARATAARAGSPFAPLLSALLHHAGTDETAPLAEQQERLANFLRSRPSLTTQQRQALVGMLATSDDRPSAGHPRPALEALLREWASRPLVLLFEDWHWADSASRELISDLAARVQQIPLLLVVTGRPGDDTPHWPGEIPLSLDPLPRQAIEALLRDLGVPEKEMEALAVASGGVPLYAEELARFGGEAPAVSQSRTLQELVTARLDAVGPAKRTARIGALVGRGFTARLVAWVDDRDPEEVSRDIETLEAAQLVLRQRTSQGVYCHFKHALVEEAIYATIPDDERRILHGRLAAVVEREFPSQTTTHPEWLADQFRRAGQPDRAAPLYLQAADRSAHLGAHAEALAHLDRAAAQARALPEDGERTALERRVARSRAAQNLFPDGWRSSSSDLALDAEDFDGLLTWILQQWPEGRWTQLIHHSQRLLAMAREQGDPDRIGTARHILGFCAFYGGDHALAEAHFQDVLPESSEATPEWLVRLYHGPPKAVELVYRGLTALWRGHYAGTEEPVERALALARAFGSPNLTGYILVLAAAYYRHSHQPHRVLALTAEARALGREEGVRLARLGALAYRQWARAALGRPTQLDRAVRVLRAEGGSGPGVVTVVALVPAYRQAGRWQDQLRLVAGILHGTDSLPASEASHSVLYTEMGRARLAMGDWADGEASLERAIAISRREGNRLRHIRAVLVLARHLRQKGEDGRAARLLEEALVLLPPDSGSPDRAVAQRLLAQTRGDRLYPLIPLR